VENAETYKTRVFKDSQARKRLSLTSTAGFSKFTRRRFYPPLREVHRTQMLERGGLSQTFKEEKPIDVHDLAVSAGARDRLGGARIPMSSLAARIRNSTVLVGRNCSALRQERSSDDADSC